MSRHAAPIDTYGDIEREARLRYEEMLAEANESIAALSKSWPEPTGVPYDISAGTGTFKAIVAG